MAWTGHQKTPVGACHASEYSARHLNFSIARPPHPRKPPHCSPTLSQFAGQPPAPLSADNRWLVLGDPGNEQSLSLSRLP